jgi:hypothetical protein
MQPGLVNMLLLVVWTNERGVKRHRFSELSPEIRGARFFCRHKA